MSTVVFLIAFLIVLAVGLVFGIVIIIGAVKMMRLKSHGMATVASVLAMLHVALRGCSACRWESGPWWC